MTANIPGMDVLVRKVGSGHLRGTEAFDAIVATIAEHETPEEASAEERQQIHDQVVLVVSQDRDLCRLVFSEPRPEPRAATEAAPPAVQQPRRERKPEPEPEPEFEDDGFDDDEIPPPPMSDAEIDAELEAIDRERAARRKGGKSRGKSRDDEEFEAEFGAPQRKGQLYGVLALVGLVAAGGAFWYLTRDDSCDRLVKSICMEGTTKTCEIVEFSKALEAEGVDDAKCASTIVAIDDAVEGLNNTERPVAFDRALVEALGFDPRGENAPKTPEPKPEGPPPPTIVLEGQPGMSGMFLDRAHVYWTSEQPPGVFRVRNIGGPVEPFGNQPSPIDVTPTRDYVYWLSRGPGGGAVWVDKVRGAHEPSTIPTVGFSPRRAAFLGAEFAFIDATTGAVMIAAVSGGEPRVLVPGRPVPEPSGGGEAPAGPPPTIPAEIAGDANTVFVATGAPVSTVWAVPRDGQTPARALATGQTAPKHLTTDLTHVYWVEGTTGSVLRVAKVGGQAQLLAQGQAKPGRLAVDDANVYWANAGDGTVVSVPKAGGELTAVATGQVNPRFVAADSVAVFWEAGGRVYRQAR